MAPCLRLCLIASSIALASLARADDAAPTARHGASLQWVRLRGAESCISGAALARAVEDKLNREIFPKTRDAELLIEGSVEQQAGDLVATLRMSASTGSELGSRELRTKGTDCAELSETVAVVLSLMIDPEARAPAPPPPAPPPPPTVVAPPEPPKEAPRHTLALLARVMLRALPSGVSLVGVGAAFERKLRALGAVRVEGIGFYDGKIDLEPPAPRGSVLFKVGYAAAHYCPVWWDTKYVLTNACAGAAVGVLVSQGIGFSERNARNLNLWLNAAFSARASVHLTDRLDAQVGVALELPTLRGRYLVERVGDQGERLLTQPAAFASFDFGIATRF